MSQIQVDNIYNKEGTGSPNFPLGANVTGVVTATTFKGGAEITGGFATFSGNVSIGGTLTYEDVTNIDSVGIVTARKGIKVLAGGIDAVGVVTAGNGVNITGNGVNITGNIGLGGANYGTAGQVLTSGGSGANATWASAGGYGSVVDEWNIEGSNSGNNGALNIPASYVYLNSGTGWAGVGGGNNGTACGNTHRTALRVGSAGVSWSNEVVSFPNTGQWKVEVFCGYVMCIASIEIQIQMSTDNGSSWNWIKKSQIQQSSGNLPLHCPVMFNVTNISNDKLRFRMYSSSANQAIIYSGGYSDWNTNAGRAKFNSIVFTKLS